MKKNSVKEEKGSFFEHSEKDLSEDRTGSILLDVIIRIRRTYFYQKYGVYVIGLIIGLLIYSMIRDVDDYLLNLGDSPQMGIKGALLVFFLVYWGFDLEFKFVTGWGLPVLVPFLGFWGWSFFYKHYRTDRYNEIMKEKNVVSGIVINKNIDFGRGYRHNMIKIGYKYNDKVYKFTVYEKMDNYQKVDVGDPILILTSREYPQVMEVLKWNPTHEDIKRYKVPRKFKSYVNGKIEEEEEQPLDIRQEIPMKEEKRETVQIMDKSKEDTQKEDELYDYEEIMILEVKETCQLLDKKKKSTDIYIDKGSQVSTKSLDRIYIEVECRDRYGKTHTGFIKRDLLQYIKTVKIKK